MVELTERERILITISHFVTHNAFTKIPDNILGKALHHVILMAYDKNMSGEELQDLIEAYKQERESIMATALGKVNEMYSN